MADRRGLIFSLVNTLVLIAALSNLVAAQKRRDVHSPNRSARFISEKLLEDKTSHPMKYLMPGNHVNVSVSMALNNILSVRPKRGEVEVVAWMNYEWTDKSLAWKKNDGGNSPSQVSIPSSLIWKPDIFPYGATKPVEELFPANVLVYNTGRVLWIPATKMTLTCDVTNYKTGSECTAKFGSWTYDDEHIDVQSPKDVIDLDNFSSPTFTVLSSKAKRVLTKYPCCKEGYSSVLFTFNFRKK